MVTAADLLVHLEAKVEAVIASGDEATVSRLEEVARFVREIAEAALVAGDEVTLREARRLAAKLVPLGFVAAVPTQEPQLGTASPAVVRTCPRCGQRFPGPAGPFERVGTLLCETCAGELLAGIRL